MKIDKTFSRENKARIYVVEDHPIFRDGLIQLINKEDDMMVCGESENADKAFKSLEETNPDLVIVDIMLKNSSGIELTKEIQKRFKNIYVLVLSMHDESIFADRVLKAGARGYITKHETTDRVIVAIRRVLSGKIYVSGDMMDRLLGIYINGGEKDESPVERLSEREFEVFNLIGHGLANRRIAEMLSLNSKTVATYRDRIKEKLNLSTSGELSRYALLWIQTSNSEKNKPLNLSIV